MKKWRKKWGCRLRRSCEFYLLFFFAFVFLFLLLCTCTFLAWVESLFMGAKVFALVFVKNKRKKKKKEKKTF